MLKIAPKEKDSYRTFAHGDDVFHKALRAVVSGREKRFHVKNPAGEDYDLVYVSNMRRMPNLPHLKGRVTIPPYYFYDEHDRSKLYLDFLAGFDALLFETFDEYSIVAGKVVLENTQMDVYYTDERVHWFIREQDRLHVVGELPRKEDVNGFVCSEEVCGGLIQGVRDQMSAEYLFHNIFVLQWLTDQPLDQMRYVEFCNTYTAGIGAILASVTRAKNAFDSLGCKTYLQPNSTRYKDIASKYFNIEETPAECDESNTIYIANGIPLQVSSFYCSFSADFHSSILKESFRTEMDEYHEMVIGDKRALGVLIRGTDYISAGYTGIRQHATVDQMLPMIHEWMDEDGYDIIFLATEDQDILDQMRAEFGNKVRAIAQERYRVSDFKKGQTISELDEENNEGRDYLDELEDTTVNYFYALYLLSKCESFMVSGQCNGGDLVKSFNDDAFKRVYQFRAGV